MPTRLASIAFFALILVTGACRKEEEPSYYGRENYATISRYLDLPESPVDFATLPLVSFQTPPPVNRDKATLGRVLFYDRNLSKDGKISCASCHQQALAFGDNQTVSKGVFDRAGERNSIALAAFTSFRSTYGGSTGTSFRGLFWDNRAHSISDQILASMANEREMDMEPYEIARAVQAQEYYYPLFEKAFGDTQIDIERITDALGTFVGSLSSVRSRFDEGRAALSREGIFDAANYPFPNYNAAENKGRALYMLHCSSCHAADMTGQMVINANNGLDVDSSDPGIGGVTGRVSDLGVFKVPVLRNIAMSAPYMHDGRFATLEAVVEHYNSGIQPHPNLHLQLKTADGQPKRLNLSESDKAALVAFLHTLTDEKFLADWRFSDPFLR